MKKIHTTKSKINQNLDSLIINAIDFLKKSIAELKVSPKYSVINFCSAIELFLKSRLLIEHWSLIISKPERANFTNFISGNFHSTSMQETIIRLKNIIGEDIGKKAQNKFNIVRNHRNQLIHFFEKNFTEKPDGKILEKIISEQYSAWFFLYSLLTQKWRIFFEDYLSNRRS